MSTVTPLGTTMGFAPMRDSLQTTLSAVRLRQPLLKAAARILWPSGATARARCCCRFCGVRGRNVGHGRR
jgi:hypothetical protein